MSMDHLPSGRTAHKFLRRQITLQLLTPVAVTAALLFILHGAMSVAAQDAAQPADLQNTPPVADFSVDPPQGVVGTRFFFNAQPSSDAEDADAWLLARFDFEDDGTWDTGWLNPTNAPYPHEYSTVNTYTVRLEVKDRDDLTDTITQLLVVSDPGTNTPPQAACTVTPTIGPPGTIFTFQATDTTDDQDALSDLLVKWDRWGTTDYRGQSWQTATLPMTATYTRLGIQEVDVLVMDSGYLMDSAECEVEIEPPGGNTAPTAHLVISPTQGTTTSQFTFDARGSTDNEDRIASLRVRFDWTDDGSFDTGWNNASQVQTHIFDDEWGTITVRAEVSDSGGLTDVTSQTITVTRIFSMHLPVLIR